MKRFVGNTLVAIFLTACLSNAWAVDPVKETRQTEPFTSIELNGGYLVFITQGPGCSLTLEGDPAILKDIKTEVKRNQLIIEPRKKLLRIKTDKVKIYLTVKEIAGLDVSGSSTVECQGAFQTEKMDINIGGSGSVTMEVSAKEIVCDIAGSGDITLKGRADNIDVDIAGSGAVKAIELEAKSAKVDIAGSGDVQVAVSQRLDGTILGSGDIVYRGTPVNVYSDIVGSGRITKSAD